jgi:imidazolonepropionase-like amidohydrolase
VRLLFAAAATLALAAPRAQQLDHYVLQCGRTHLGDGRVLERSWIVVKQGRFDYVGQEQPTDASLPVIDLRDRVVIPGLIAADTDLAGHSDSDYQLTPDFVAVEGFDFTRKRERALSGGVTTAYLAPGRRRLIPGQGSVVKLAGDDAARRVLAATQSLRVTLGDASTSAPPLFEPTEAPSSDDPLLPARRQMPSARISQLAELRRVFREAQVATQEGRDDVGEGRDEEQYDPAPLMRVLRGELPLRVAAPRADDIRRALQLAGSLGSRLVLEDPAEIDKVAALVARAAARASFRLPVRPGASNPGGENKLDKSPRVTAEAVVALARLGVAVALAPGHDDDLAEFLTVAALAVRAGLPAEAALTAITSGAAKVLGVDERVGLVTPGRDADFVVLSGEPLAIGTVVEKTYVDGRLAYARQTASDLLAIRARRVLPANGPALRDAVVLIEKGKIKAVGEGLPIPYGARVIETSGVAVPGFVDAYCHAGLSAIGGDGLVPRGAPEQMVADAIDRDDVNLRGALAAGITTVVVSGKDEAAVSGRAAALKTGARDHQAMVLDSIAALRLVHDAFGPGAVAPLDSLLERAKSYVESWQRYEKARAEGKEVEVVAEKPAENDPITGVWEGDLENSQIPIPISFNLNLKLAGEAVTGQVATVFRGTERPPVDLENGTFKDGKLRLSFSMGMGGTLTLDATVADDNLDGELTGGFGGKLKAKRVSKDAPAGGSSTGLTKPRIDEALEPARALLEGKATAIVRTTRAPALAEVAAWAVKNKVKLAFHGAGDAVASPAVLGESKPGVMLEPDFVRTEDGATVNRAKQFSEAGVKVALVSGGTGGARYLPVHAAYAVRHGLDSDTALRAITLHPAAMLGLDDRIGSLAPGKDADLVLFSGDPFELTSRVEVVICNGEVVIDNRKR